MSTDEAEAPPPSRYTQWFATLAFSIVALAGFTTTWAGGIGDQPKEVKWSVSAIIIALSLSALAVIAHALARGKFVGTLVEGGLAFIIMCIMAAALPAIMDPGNGISTQAPGIIINANIYFFSWGTFFMSLFVCMHYFYTVHGVGKSIEYGFHSNPLLWIILVATSFIVMASATRLYKNESEDNTGRVYQCHVDNSPDTCSRLEFAVAAGAFSAVVACIWAIVGFCKQLPAMCDLGLAIVMLVLWCFGIGFITYGEAAPASFVGNLYFSTWGSFILTCLLTSNASSAVFSPKPEEESPEEGEPKEGEDVVEVEGDAEAGEADPVADTPKDEQI